MKWRATDSLAFWSYWLLLLAASAESLTEASSRLGKTLPAGGIVIAESAGRVPVFSAAGHLEPAGLAPKDRLFEIGSITKVFNGLLLAQAVVEEKVTLETTLSSLLKDLSFADKRVGDITLRQLACHTSGLPRLPANLGLGSDQLDPYAHYGRAQLEAALSHVELEGASPQPWSYSNLGAGLLGDLLSRVYARPWEKLIREKITEPLGMKDTVVTLNEDQRKRLAPPHFQDERVKNWHFQALAGAGALRSTAQDLHRFGHALLKPQDTKLTEAIKLLVQTRSANGKHGLALGHWSRSNETIMGHDGGTGGYRSLLEIVPATRTIRVILINNTCLEPSHLLVPASKKDQVETPSRAITPEQAQEFVGIYEIPTGPLRGSHFTVIHRGAAVWGKLTGQRFLRFHPHEKSDRFFLKEVKAEFQFGREGKKITSLTLHQGGQAYSSRRTDKALPDHLRATVSEEKLTAYLGRYQLTPNMAFTVTIQGGLLFARLTGQEAIPFFQQKPDRFQAEVVKAALEFERDEEGKIIALKLHQNGRVQRAPQLKDE